MDRWQRPDHDEHAAEGNLVGMLQGEPIVVDLVVLQDDEYILWKPHTGRRPVHAQGKCQTVSSTLAGKDRRLRNSSSRRYIQINRTTRMRTAMLPDMKTMMRRRIPDRRMGVKTT